MVKIFLLLLAVGIAVRDCKGNDDLLERQKQVVDLYLGLGHSQHFNNQHADWNISANFGKFEDEKYPKEFLAAYESGFTTQEGIVSSDSKHFVPEAIKLFDLFYFAKDFDTFYKAASWARFHINPAMFGYTYTMALFHRPDTQRLKVPDLHEVFPNYFVPQDTLRQVFEYKMLGLKKGTFKYNTTGWEYDYRAGEFNGPLSLDNRDNSDFKLSYFMEDVALNSFGAYWIYIHPSWMSVEKYGALPQLERKGEKFYYVIQQLLARYTLERIANGLPNTPVLDWNKPIKVGYNPRVTYLNGKSMYVRPDNMVPKEANFRKALMTDNLERRIYDVIDAGMLQDLTNQSFIKLTEENGTDILGRLIFGSSDRPNKNFFRSIYYSGLHTLAYIASTATDRSFVGNAMSTPMTALRDPAYYSYLTRILFHFQYYKETLGPYKHKDIFYPGVSVENVEVDRFVTFYNKLEYEVTNAVPMAQMKDYQDHLYKVRQFCLNHDPYHFNVTVKSNQKENAVVRVFIGPHHNTYKHILNVHQARLSYFEIDRFQVKLNPGVQVIRRSSTESPIFSNDQTGLRYSHDAAHMKFTRFGFPYSLQLPMGSKGGTAFRLAVIVSPLDAKYSIDDLSIYDGRAMGFPFDRPISDEVFNHMPNLFFKDENIYHK